MPEFDPHASIKRLAEVEIEQECQDCAGTGAVYKLRDCESTLIPSRCAPCAGTGRIVPFASLRVECNPDSFDHQRGTCDCEDSGWVPEPAVEKACWRIYKVLLNQEIVGWWLDSFRKWRFSRGIEHSRADSEEEAVLRAAEAWVKERRGGD